MVTSYTGEAYFTVSLLLSFNQGIYRKLAEDTWNSYTTGQDNDPQTIPNMKNLLVKFHNRECTKLKPTTGVLSFTKIAQTMRSPDLPMVYIAVDQEGDNEIST